jgi:alpha-glucuronidase
MDFQNIEPVLPLQLQRTKTAIKLKWQILISYRNLQQKGGSGDFIRG